ncbi:Sec34-like family-domain-containing protein [Lentinula aciculospora]|uniref:Conserved oligomeric Golgi complex subunit 3 n=1 Tax=Lentinula aciculospora TaxID=153920 RepID=A0A9W9ATD0_9AGAR|nr:Sec34-like family-domain-containing protein [Lentinula aciculospora]
MSRRGTTPNPLPLGPFSSPFAQFTSQSQTIQQQPKARPNTLAPRASPLARSPSGLSPSNALSVEEWETKALLNDIQTRSVAAVKKASEIKRIPEKFDTTNTGKDSPSRPSTPLTKRLLPSAITPGTPGSASRPETPSRYGPTSYKLHPKQPLHTPQQFYDWHALISRSVTHAQESHFRAHLDSVSSHVETCDFLISQIDLVENELTSMHSQWQGVEDGGRSLKESSEGLLIERDTLLKLESGLGERLDHFKELEYATRMLNAPVLESSGGKGGKPLVMESEFLDMVERVVICIQWLEAHRHYREAEIYLLRFHQCLTRAMTLIKMYFVGSLRAVQADVARRFGDKAAFSSEQTTHHLLYTRFRALTSPSSTAYNSATPTHHVPSSLRPLLLELEYRARSYPTELNALLGECHTAYLSARKALVGPVVRAEVEGLVKGVDLASGTGGTSDVVELTRAGCSYVKQLCTDEFDLFKEFFDTGEDFLYNYLETLCDYLYDDLRPRILHEPRLTALCEVCTVLQALMVLDVHVDDDGESESDFTHVDEELELDLNLDPTLRTPDLNSRALGHSKPRLHISQLLQMILQDAQTRLFFKAQAVVQSDIRHYVAKDDDLAYPAMLLNAVGLSDSLLRDRANEKESFSQMWSSQLGSDKDRGASLDNQQIWFPTLRKTILVLEQLHDFVNPAIFEDIAEEAIVLCQSSLIAASENIVNSASSSSNRTTPSSEVHTTAPEPIARSTLLDGYLFLVRHLLILREVPARFGLSTESTDNIPHSNAGKTSTWNGLSGFEPQKAGMGASGSVTDTLASLFGGGSAASLLATLGVFPSDFGDTGRPDNKRTIDNAKRSINQSLRLACENTIATCTNEVCEPLRMWVERVGAFSAASAFSKGDIRTSFSASSNISASSSNQSVGSKDVKGVPDWASPSSASEVDHNFKMACEEKLLLAVRKIRLYLGGVVTVEEEIKNPDDTDEIFHDGENGPISSPNTSARALSNVIVQHVQERIGEEYAWFRDVLWGMSTDVGSTDKTGASALYTEDQVKELKELRERILDQRTLRAMLKGITEGH